jgi:hypothetical protein
MGEAKKKAENADKELTEQLEETFPASDALSVTREPADKQAKDGAASPERKAARVSGSAEAQPQAPKK